jgi:hydroxymethylbilane synthase
VKIRLGTRGSALARIQADSVARLLRLAGHDVEIVVISTRGDSVADRAFTDIGAFGVFVREIESALLAREVDVAVHSYKDLPSRSADNLVVAATPERADAADVLLFRPDAHGALREGARVGTSAVRRHALVREQWPDAEPVLLRGNVPTRVRALASGRYDAIVVASAGLLRLADADGSLRFDVPATLARRRLDPRVFIPAPSQGALALQVRSDDVAVHDAVAPLNDPLAANVLRAERHALALVEGGCTLPFGAYCEAESGGSLRLHALLATDDGAVTRTVAVGDDPEAVAVRAMADLLSQRPSATNATTGAWVK